MAQEGRIQAEHFNLKDILSLQKLCSSIERANLKIAALDFSNAQGETYLGCQGTDAVITELKAVLHPKAIILFCWFSSPQIMYEMHQEYTAFLVENYDIAIFNDNSEHKKRLLASVSDHDCPDPNSSAYYKLEQSREKYSVGSLFYTLLNVTSFSFGK